MQEQRGYKQYFIAKRLLKIMKEKKLSIKEAREAIEDLRVMVEEIANENPLNLKQN